MPPFSSTRHLMGSMPLPSERNSVTGVRNHQQRYHSSASLPLHQGDSPLRFGEMLNFGKSGKMKKKVKKWINQTYIHLCVCVCVWAHTYTRTHTHTHTHTHIYIYIYILPACYSHPEGIQCLLCSSWFDVAPCFSKMSQQLSRWSLCLSK